MKLDEGSRRVLRSVWSWIKYAIIPPTAIWFVYHDLLFNFISSNPYVIFITLAAFFNANMDVTSHHYENSIFKLKNPYFFNPDMSWISRYQKMPSVRGYDLDKPRKFLCFNYPFSPDFWHLCKVGMIVSFACAIVLYKPQVSWIDLLFIGYIYNTVFSLFYDKLLRKRA